MFGLHGSGGSWLEAIVLSGVIVVALLVTSVAGWLLPERYSGRKLWTIAAVMMLGTYAGGLGGLVGKGRFGATPVEQWPRAAAGRLLARHAVPADCRADDGGAGVGFEHSAAATAGSKCPSATMA